MNKNKGGRPAMDESDRKVKRGYTLSPDVVEVLELNAETRGGKKHSVSMFLDNYLRTTLCGGWESRV